MFAFKKTIPYSTRPDKPINMVLTELKVQDWKIYSVSSLSVILLFTVITLEQPAVESAETKLATF